MGNKARKFVAALTATCLAGLGVIAFAAPSSAEKPSETPSYCGPEISHQEWGSEERTRSWIPDVAEVSHLEFTYKKSVDDYKTRYQYQKQVKGDIEKKTGGTWRDDGDFPFEFWTSANGWNTSGSFQWSFEDKAVLESGGHNDISATFDGNKRKHSTAYQYVKNGVVEQVKTGSHWETKDWTTEVLGAPWIKTGERKVVDTAAVPGYFTEWSAWTTRTSGDLAEPTLPENTVDHEYRITGPVKVVDQEEVPCKKVYVCKYVGTPGVDERLQTGQNPIEVSVNAIQNNQWDGTVPGWFSDAHDRSYVLGYVPMDPEPDLSDCPNTTKPEPLKGTDSGQTDPVCVDPLNGTATYSTWTQDWTQGHTWNGSAWVLGEKVYSEKVYTEHTVDSENCIPTKPEPKTGTDKGETQPVCVDPKNGTSTYQTWTRSWTQDYTWTEGEWVLGEKVYGEKVFTDHVIDAEDCIPTKPEPVTVYDYDKDKECVADGNKTITFLKRDGVRSYTWDNASKEYVLGEPVWGEWYEVDSKTFPSEDCAPVIPEPKVEKFEGDWVDGTWVCGDTTVVQTRQTWTITTTYEWEWVPAETEQSEKAYAKGEWKLVETVGDKVFGEDEENIRELTQDEIGECPLTPGNIQAVCVLDVPTLAYGVDLPEGYVPDSANPVTITFTKGSNSYTLPGTYPLNGSVLWPGASNVFPMSWPGYITNPDGTYTKTDDPARFGWTREGATVTFSVNPEYSTVVAYPAATSLCANPPAPKPITPVSSVTPKSPTLAATGAETWAIGGLAALVLIVGASAVAVSRRRTVTQD